MSIKFLVILTLIGLLSGCQSERLAKENTQAQGAKKPNIIVVLIDDAGYVDFGFMGSKDLDTPHIDKLAQRGVVFTDAHVSATVCAPSRAGLITGRYQQRFGYEANGTGDEKSGELGLADDVTTLAEVFGQNNYQTIALGKWHLGYNQSDHPNQRGFDEFYGFLAGGRSYFPLQKPSAHQMLQQNGKRVVFDGYMTDVLGDRAVEFIDENKNNPFFMYLAFNAVHTPMDAKAEHLEKYSGHPRQKLAAMTWSLDENVGKLIAKLQATEQLDNTLIFFLSDNGGATLNSSLNGPLKGFKGNKFEAGHRVPFVMHWPGTIESNQKFSGLSSALDIFTTALAAAGIEADNDLVLDGVDLLPYLQGHKQGNPHDKLFWRKLGKSALRSGDNKLISLAGYGSVLYNLKDDLGETVDLSQTDPVTFNRLTAELNNWQQDLMEPLWGEGHWLAINFDIHKNLMLNNYRDVESYKAFQQANNKNINE